MENNWCEKHLKSHQPAGWQDMKNVQMLNWWIGYDRTFDIGKTGVTFLNCIEQQLVNIQSFHVTSFMPNWHKLLGLVHGPKTHVLGEACWPKATANFEAALVIFCTNNGTSRNIRPYFTGKKKNIIYNMLLLCLLLYIIERIWKDYMDYR